MKKQLLITALILGLFLPSFTVNYSVQAQEPISQSYSDSGSSISWVINEPKNQTYNTANLNLSVTGRTFMATLTNISYSVDGKPRTFLHIVGEKPVDDPITQQRRGYTQLPPLSIGIHKITVYIDGWAGFPSKTIPTQKTIINVGINVATPVQDNHTHGNGATIYSPYNQTYQPNQAISISVSSPTLGGSNIIYSATYTLDDGPLRQLDTESRQIHSWDPFFGALIGTGTLPPLLEGQHKLTVYMKTYIQTTANPTISGEATVYFSIGDTEPPEISLNGINNATFNQTSIPLTFTTNETTSWMGYCLDNGTQTTITGNTSLTVTPGNHTIRMYANDTKGNLGQSEMERFTVQLPEVSSEPKTTQIVLLTLVSTCIAIAIVALFVYLKNKKPGKMEIARI